MKWIKKKQETIEATLITRDNRKKVIEDISNCLMDHISTCSVNIDLDSKKINNGYYDNRVVVMGDNDYCILGVNDTSEFLKNHIPEIKKET